MKNKNQRNSSSRKQRFAEAGDVCRVISHFSRYYSTFYDQNLIVVSIENSYCTRMRRGPPRKTMNVAMVMLPNGKIESINLSDLVPLPAKPRSVD